VPKIENLLKPGGEFLLGITVYLVLT
jgi:hypothetical protein